MARTASDQGLDLRRTRPVGRRWWCAVRLLDRDPHRSRRRGARLPPHPPGALHRPQLLCAWIAGELAFQNIVWQAVATALFIWAGALGELGRLARVWPWPSPTGSG